MPVTFDAATSAVEDSGDGILSLTHTASGSNRAAFASGSGYGSGSGPTSASMTYNAVSMGTPLWDLHTAAASNLFNSGYVMVAPPTGAQTVVHTTSAAPSNHFLSVVTVTDCHQTTPTGAAVTTGPQGTSPWLATVASVGTDDLVIDSMVGNGTNSLTPAANQVQRTNRNNASVTVWMGSSTKLGSFASGAMQWAIPTPIDGLLGAVAFKPAAGGGGPAGKPTAYYHQMRRAA